MNKFLRECSFMGVRNRVNKLQPGFDQYLTASRLPKVPRIVVYSQTEEANTVISRYTQIKPDYSQILNGSTPRKRPKPTTRRSPIHLPNKSSGQAFILVLPYLGSHVTSGKHCCLINTLTESTWLSTRSREKTKSMRPRLPIC